MDTEHLCLLFLSKSYFLSNNCYFGCLHLGVSKNIRTPKWMVKIMENPTNTSMIWGENPPIFGNIHLCFSWNSSGVASLPEFLVSSRFRRRRFRGRFFLGKIFVQQKNHQVPNFYQPFASSPLLFVPPKKVETPTQPLKTSSQPIQAIHTSLVTSQLCKMTVSGGRAKRGTKWICTVFFAANWTRPWQLPAE